MKSLSYETTNANFEVIKALGYYCRKLPYLGNKSNLMLTDLEKK